MPVHRSFRHSRSSCHPTEGQVFAFLEQSRDSFQYPLADCLRPSVAHAMAYHGSQTAILTVKLSITRAAAGSLRQISWAEHSPLLRGMNLPKSRSPSRFLLRDSS